MKSAHAVLAFAILLVTLGCRDLGTASDPQQGGSRPLTSIERSLVSSGNTFGFALFNSVNRTESGRNLFISPVSVSLAFGMTLNGARGATRDSIARTLALAGLSQTDINASYKSLIALLTTLDPVVAMQIANSIWNRPDLNVQQDFKDLNAEYFNASVRSLNFADPTAAKTINGWVDENTHGRITEIVQDPIPTDMVMYLINAIYFKGSWTYRFDSTATRDDSFFPSSGSRTSCRMMFQGGSYSYFSNDEVQVVDLPYGQGNFTATIVLPSSNSNIESFSQSLTQEKWNG
ncbi:MAG TPA: serpin family protein, partial [Bacteroidota bacterium]|nr:serpin family protein [Bacteroidota bacterium]